MFEKLATNVVLAFVMMYKFAFGFVGVGVGVGFGAAAAKTVPDKRKQPNRPTSVFIVYLPERVSVCHTGKFII